ncbi:MAG: WbqC family protein [Bacteroidia bacterium]
MQPYLFPYIGYFQLMNAVDKFVIYDNIQYTKKGWINRNRILMNGKDEYLSVPLKKDSDFLDIRDRFLAENWPAERTKIVNRLANCYRKAPHFATAFPLIEKCLLHEDTNLFNYILHSLNVLAEAMEIKTELVVSSTINTDHNLRSEKRVIAICKALNSADYLNPIGGIELYKKEDFEKEGIKLNFIKTTNFEYPQFGAGFVPFLSIIDILMFNDKEKIKEYLNHNYTIL